MREASIGFAIRVASGVVVRVASRVVVRVASRVAVVGFRVEVAAAGLGVKGWVFTVSSSTINGESACFSIKLFISKGYVFK